MASLYDMVRFLDTYLAIDEIEDSCWNGLQFEGSVEVTTVVTAVDSSVETFELAAAEGAQMVVVHHGLFWKGLNPSLTGWTRRRIDYLAARRMSLYACHLPLDRHPEVGNNARLLAMMGASIEGGFFEERGKNVGWVGVMEDPSPLERVTALLEEGLGGPLKILPFGPRMVRRVAVCSGGGGYRGFHEALSLGVDLYVTGDTVEVYATARDAGLSVVFGGHHATETLGPKALVPVLQERFGVKALFVDVPTGL